ncbi:hypothetical protein [Streptomyces sp. NRRL S-244]|uniref:hypothetical protein n=1 Tax=Streptomyces sp. NRRL S-244 TaxID=1463897 RepID=UPI0004BE6452|nr:hypothetical protein [Streptomyces sp. NRRL S-244]
MPEYASSDEEAEKDLIAYCEKIDFDPEWVAADKWASSIRIAQQKEYGFVQARKTILSDQEELVKAGARDARKAKLDSDAADLLAQIKYDHNLKDSLVVTILNQCAAAYVGGERVNLGLGGAPMDRGAYGDLRDEWTAAAELADGGVFTGFVSHAPQNKAVLGKGQVGSTLAKRKVQGNLLVRIAGVRFNMHIDIAD